MDQLNLINFTYASPLEDMEQSAGINPDGSINVVYTLTELRNLLMSNINVLDRLIAVTANINNISALGYDTVAITVDSEDVLETLLNDKIIVRAKNMDFSDDGDGDSNNSDDLRIFNELFPDSDEDSETHNDRLNMVRNIVNQNLVEKSMSSSNSDSDNIIQDNNNLQAIINKYKTLYNNTDTDTSSEDSM